MQSEADMNGRDEKRTIMNRERIWTLSNIVSSLRAAMAIPIIISLSKENVFWVTFFIALALISDAIDGMLARKYNAVTLLGKALDPIADKICVLSITLFLIIKDRIPFHFLIFLMTRDLILALMNIYLMNLKSFVTGTNIIGKTSVVMVALTLIAAIYKIEPLRDIFMMLSYILLMISFIQYALIFIRNFGKAKPNRL